MTSAIPGSIELTCLAGNPVGREMPFNQKQQDNYEMSKRTDGIAEAHKNHACPFAHRTHTHTHDLCIGFFPCGTTNHKSARNTATKHVHTQARNSSDVHVNLRTNANTSYIMTNICCAPCSTRTRSLAHASVFSTFGICLHFERMSCPPRHTES